VKNSVRWFIAHSNQYISVADPKQFASDPDPAFQVIMDPYWSRPYLELFPHSLLHKAFHYDGIKKTQSIIYYLNTIFNLKSIIFTGFPSIGPDPDPKLRITDPDPTKSFLSERI